MFGVAKIVQGESKEKQKPQDFDFSLPSRRLSSRSRVVQGESKEKKSRRILIFLCRAAAYLREAE